MPDGAVPPPAAEWRGTAIGYPHRNAPAIGPFDLRLEAGERVLLLGPSGSGKSSLLLALTGLVPNSVPASVAGETRIGGRPAGERSPAEWADTVAHYFQDADQVLCGMRVKDEIAFAPENMALPPAEIENRVAAAMAKLGLPPEWLHRRSLSMSGGERQLVALAAILAQGAPILLVDEPTAHLSPEATHRLRAILADPAPNRATLVVDHRLDGLVESIDRVAVLGRTGSPIAHGSPRAVFRRHHAVMAAQGIWRPAASDLDALLLAQGVRLDPAPLSVVEALGGLESAGFADTERAYRAVARFSAERLPPGPAPRPRGVPVAALEGANCAPFGGPVVLGDVDLRVHAGEIVAVLGRNGAGKSTLGASLAGLLRLRKGRRVGAAGALALQRPEDQFGAATVRDEIAAMLPSGLDGAERSARVAAAIAAFGLGGLEDRHPFTLSEGEKRRAVLAAIEAAADRWPLLVLDEPTAGLDAAGAAGLVRRLDALRGGERAAVVITHDMDLALRLADRAVIVGNGGVVADGPAADILLDAGLLARNGLGEPVVAPALRWLAARAPRC